MGLRITTWNVNGIRNPFGYQPWREQRTFQAMFDILEADIVIMQETKIQRKDLQDDMVLVPGWDVFFNLPKYKKGYSGVAIYTRNETCAPIRAEEGITGVLCPPKSTTKFRDLPLDQQIGGYPRPGQLSGAVDDAMLDSEGRCVILEFPGFVLLGVYCPANRDESRVEFRTSFFEALDVRIRNLVAEGKQVILTGDLNVIRSDMDSTNVLEMLRKEDMTMDEWISLPTRRVFNQLIFEGTIVGDRDEGREKPVLWDLCRNFHPTRLGMNTCWDTKKNTRPANNGSRIDYILCSDGIKDWFTHANIQEGLMGSDHCPVFATLADTIQVSGGEAAISDIMNPSGVFKNGVRVRKLGQKDLLPLSAKLIPEFDRRQSIRDMFFKKTTPTPGMPIDSPNSEALVKSTNNVGQIEANKTPGAVNPEDANNLASEAANMSTEKTLTIPFQPPLQKRPPEPAELATRQLKRSKSGAESSLNKQQSVSGQKSLKGFFKPVSSATGSASMLGRQGARTQDSPPRITPLGTASASAKPANSEHAKNVSSEQKTVESSLSDESVVKSDERVFDPIENKESWSKLLGKRVVPRCEHDEPCISLVTKKPGVNRGRSFYICPRPLGPSGEKEKGSEWRCGTFIWSSDWNGTCT